MHLFTCEYLYGWFSLISLIITLWYFVFLYLIFLSQQVLYFLLSTLVLTLYIDVVLSLSIDDSNWEIPKNYRVMFNKERCMSMQYPLTIIVIANWLWQYSWLSYQDEKTNTMMSIPDEHNCPCSFLVHRPMVECTSKVKTAFITQTYEIHDTDIALTNLQRLTYNQMSISRWI